MEYHQHQIGDYLKCPRLFQLRHVRRLAPKTQPRYINVGSLFAKGVELLHQGKSMVEVFEQAIDKEANKLTSSATSGEVINDIITDTYTVEAMLNGYKKWFIDENDLLIPKITHIFPEFRIEGLKGVDWFQFNYVTRLDGLCYDTNNHQWILEIKTSIIPPDMLVRVLATNFQINSYHMQLLGSSSYEIDGVIYRIVKKPTIRQKKNESVEQFRFRLTDDYITRKEFYFHQIPVYFKEFAVIEFRNEFDMWILKLKDSFEKEFWPKNGFSCRNNNSECMFLKYCADPTEETIETHYKVVEKNETVEDRGNDEQDT